MTSTAKTKRFITRAQACNAYAKGIVSGEIPSGLFVKRVCQRHLDDLKAMRRADFPYRWDAAAAGRTMCFVEDTCVLRIGDADGAPFKLIDWQSFLIGSVYGWKRKDTGRRRYMEVYCQVAKAAGKTPLAAALALHALVADGEPYPLVNVMARDFAQAGIVFDSMITTVEHHNGFNKHVEIYGGKMRNDALLLLDENGHKKGEARRLTNSPDGRGKSGYTPSFNVFDEVAEWNDSVMLDIVRRNTKNRTQAINFFITNAGAGVDSVAWPYYEKARAVAFGEADVPDHFPLVFELDPDDDPMDESVWKKTNPSVDITPGWDYLRREAKNAEAMPVLKSMFLRMHQNKWVESGADYFIDIDRVDEVFVDKLDDSKLKQLPLVVGLDLSENRDLSAAVLLWKDGDKFYARAHFWLPEEGLAERGRRQNLPFEVWVRDGYLTATPGSIIDYEYVARWLKEVDAQWHVRAAASDKYNVKYFAKVCESVGLGYHSPDTYGLKTRPRGAMLFYHHPQGYYQSNPKKQKGQSVCDNGLTDSLWFPGSVKMLENAVLTNAIEIEENPVLRWNFLGVKVKTDDHLNKLVDKRKSASSIDGVVALINGMGVQAVLPPPPVRKKRLVAQL